MKSKGKSKETIRRHADALIRLYARQTRPDARQLELLEARGAGHCKEAQKIRERLAAPKNDRRERRARARRS